MYKRSSFGMIPTPMQGPTIGSLEDLIMGDQLMDMSRKRMALQRLRQETAGLPRQTPLQLVMSRLGGGALGYVIAKFFGMSPVGQMLTTMAGFGLGKTMGDFYAAEQDKEKWGLNWIR